MGIQGALRDLCLRRSRYWELPLAPRHRRPLLLIRLIGRHSQIPELLQMLFREQRGAPRRATRGLRATNSRLPDTPIPGLRLASNLVSDPQLALHVWFRGGPFDLCIDLVGVLTTMVSSRASSGCDTQANETGLRRRRFTASTSPTSCSLRERASGRPA
ncbi:hypothetical protein E4U49_002645 [Claviceps purpurea]|nr:hypothetical protein E4U49_002645 [Claviceps purpurea]